VRFEFRSFRARVLTTVIGLLVLVQAGVLLSVHLANLGVAKQHVAEALALTARAFSRVLAAREGVLVEKARLLSSDFAFKQVAATGDRATILSALRNHSARVGADVMLLLDPGGEVVADTLPLGTAQELRPLLDAARRDDFGEASSILFLSGVPYQLVVVPLFTPEPSAWIVIGFRIGDPLARQLQKETGTHVSLLRRQAGRWEAFSTTLPEGAGPALEQALVEEHPATGRSVSLELGGKEYVSWVAPLNEVGSNLIAVLQRPLDEALAPFLRLRTVLGVVFAVGILLSLLGSALLASAVTRPVADLVRGARRIERGNYADPVVVKQRDELGALASSFNAMMKGLAERDQVRDLLGRVVAPEVAEELLRTEIELGGEERSVSVLFADIRGFTGLSEREEPQRLVRTLNFFLGAVSQAIEAEGGVVEEYMGDGAKALFGAPVGHPDDPLRAVRAALALQASMPEVNAQIAELGAGPLAIGIGINTARVVAGKMGSLSRLKYTVVGDGVNLASRLEGLTRIYGVPIIVSAATRDRCPGVVFRELDRVRVKGRDTAVVIYEPLGAAEELDASRSELAELHATALARLRACDWDAAAAGFEALARRQPGSPLYPFYLGRIERLRREPPGPGWDGTLVHEQK
jgi:adenylate cyclase